MRDFYFYSIMRNTIVQFLDMFNDIRVARYDADTGEIIKYVSLPVKFAPKTKQFYWVEKRDEEGGLIRDKILPIMGVNLTSVDFANERQVNKLRRLTKGRDAELIEKYMNPVPFDYAFEVAVAAEYMVDITQIMEQILPYFTPTANIRITIPELAVDHDSDYGGYPLDLKVIYEGVTPDMPVDMGEEEYRAIVWTMTFKVEGYLSQPVREEKLIKKVDARVYTTESSWDKSLDTTTELISGAGGHQDIEILTYATSGVKYDEDMRILYDYEVYGG